MRTRLVVLLSLLAVVLFAGVWSLRPHRAAPTIEHFDPAAMQKREPDRRLFLWLAKDANGDSNVVTRLANAYRVPVDRRMSAAVRELHEILVPAPQAPALHVDWNEDHWEVAVAGEPAGELAEFPTFAEGLALVESSARARLADKPMPKGAAASEATAFVAGYLPEQALPLIDDQVRREGVTVATVVQAADACSQLAFLMQQDRSELADTTMARALALLALARAAGAGPQPRIAARLAWAMGYSAEAATLAAALPAQDALRRYVQGEREALLKPTADASAEWRIVSRMALAERGDRDGWLASLHDLDPLPALQHRPALATALAFRRFDITEWLGPELLEAALLGMPDMPGEVLPDSVTIMTFARGIARPSIAARGPLTGGAIAAARRALFASGLMVCHDYLATTLASPAAMRDWSDDLARLAGTPVERFATWERHMAEAVDDRKACAPLWDDLADPELAAPCALRSYHILQSRLITGFIDDRSALRMLIAKLDTRPANMVELAEDVQQHVQWPELTERLLVHGARCSTNGNTARILLALFQGEPSRLMTLIADPHTDTEEARRVVRLWIATDSTSADALLPSLERVVARTPTDWSSAADLAHLLEARGHHGEAESVVARWCLNAPGDADALDSTLAVTLWARLQREQGHLDQALVTIGDLDRGMQRGAMSEKAIILASLGHIDDAIAIAHRVYRRYPQSREAAVLPAELQWRAGRMDDAARTAISLSEEDTGAWTALAAGFANTFRGKPEPMARALAALRARGASYRSVLWHLAYAFQNAGDRTTAAQLAVEASPGSGGIRGIGIARLYGMLDGTSGSAVADAWLAKQHMDEGARVLAGLLLTLQPAPGPAFRLAAMGDTEYDWVLRAAAWRMGGALEGPQADSLRLHMATPGDDHYRPMVRYLMGEVDEAEVLSLARDPRRCAETWFFCGVRAWSDGRSRDAMRWFTLCQETGSINDAEVLSSHFTMAEWCNKWCTSERMLPSRRVRA